jgi:hypothetical protein
MVNTQLSVASLLADECSTAVKHLSGQPDKKARRAVQTIGAMRPPD